ncbi:hypothetical protein POF73_31985 [Streptomyces sp. HD]|nr:hypothetical protein [Streptomyces sp. HD]MDC0771477.1 hypothetical protein [Streptomyces sp. HD]
MSRGERVFRIADLTAEHQRWPVYAPQARKLGIGSMMGFLFTEEEDLGALNLFNSIKLREVARRVCEEGTLS